MSVLSRRQELEAQVQALLANQSEGRLRHTQETESIDFKEEAGRRTGKQIEPGSPQNPEAATKLANEVACLANTPGGGALILGVEDKTGQIIGTELDRDWLRQRINQQIQVAPDIIATEVAGQRLLIIYVAAAREPVTNTNHALRWRVGDSCVAVDRAEWWEHKDRSQDTDPMAQRSAFTLQDASATSVQLARSWNDSDKSLTDEEILRQLGALRSDGMLSEAGALLFVPQQRSYLEFTVFDVPGGSVTNRITGAPTAALLEQLSTIENTLSAVNSLVTEQSGFSHRHTRRVPELAAREAILNGVIHRDWNRSEPTDVRWVEADSSLTVRSPGGFFGSVNENNVLSNRDARYPAIADLFRAIGLVDKQGVGVDRMYQAMIVLGHRPPEIQSVAGAYIECTLTGGEPVHPIVDLVSRIVPTARQKDYRVAIIIYLLLHHPVIGVADVARLMQSTEEAARLAIETARQTAVDGEPLITTYKDVWIFGKAALNRAKAAHDPDSVFPLLPYHSTEQDRLAVAVRQWLSLHPAITTGDLMAIAPISRGTAKRALDELVDGEVLRLRGSGRSTRYEPITD